MDLEKAHFRTYNLLLGALTEAEFTQLCPTFEAIPLKRNQLLGPLTAQIDYLYFVTSGLVSTQATMKNGASAEMFLVGREGCVNFGALASAVHPTHQNIVQSAGSALRVRADLIRAGSLRNERAGAILYQYLHTQLQEAGQVSACNALHSVEQRLARRLLTMADRNGSEVIEITHEQLSRMMGTKRSTISVSAKRFEEQGFIQYDYARILIRQRRMLERVACECYFHIRELGSSTAWPASPATR